MATADTLIAQQAARVVRAFDAFEKARASSARQRRAAELETELGALKTALMYRKLAAAESAGTPS